LDSRINSEAPDRARGRSIAQRSADTPPRFIAESRFTEWDDEDVPALFAEHYTTGTRRELPFMHLDGPEPILKLLTAGGFMEVAAEPRPDLGLGNGVPYLITATTR
jgi:hypothetical protein